MNRAQVGVVIMVIGLGAATGAALLQTKREVLATREQAHGELEQRIRDRARGDRIEAAWNPGHLVPMTEDVFSGVPDELVRPTPVDPALARPSYPPAESTKVEIEWTSARQVRALIDRRLNGPRGDSAFVAGVAADFEALAAVIIPVEPR